MPRSQKVLEYAGRTVSLGRHPLLTTRQLPQFKKLLIHCVGQPRSVILQRVRQMFHVSMEPRTYRKYAALVGAPYVRIPSRPPLSDRTRKLRLNFARKHRNLRGLCDVVVADEKAFKSIPAVAFGRIPRGSGITMPRVHHPLSINVWWAASGSYTTEPVFYSETLTGPRYASILRTNLHPLLQRSQNRCHFIQDNLRAHYTPECRAFFNTERIFVMDDFPPFSPDIQPMENWWAIAQEEVYRLAPTTRAALEDAVRQGLKKVTVAIRRRTLKGLPGRLKYILDHNGDYTGH